MRDQLWTQLADLREPLRKHRDDAPVILLARRPQERLIRRFLNEAVLEDVAGGGGNPALEEKPRRNEARELPLQNSRIEGRDGLEQLVGELAADRRRELRDGLGLGKPVEPRRQ